MICPLGLGGGGLSPPRGVGSSARPRAHYSAWEDRVWPASTHGCGLRERWTCRNFSSTGECLFSEDRGWLQAAGDPPQLANSACVVVPARRLLFSIVWKTGTRTLLAFLRCAFGQAHVVHYPFEQVGAALGDHPCERVPADYLHVAGVREPFDRFLSGYREFVLRTATPHRPGAIRSTVSTVDSARYHATATPRLYTAQRFLQFVAESSCRTRDAWAHVASQSWFIRRRRVDIFLRTEELGGDLVRAFGSPQCVPRSRVNHHAGIVDGVLSESSYYDMLRKSKPLRRALCTRMAQDILCLFCGRAAVDCGFAAQRKRAPNASASDRASLHCRSAAALVPSRTVEHLRLAGSRGDGPADVRWSHGRGRLHRRRTG